MGFFWNSDFSKKNENQEPLKIEEIVCDHYTKPLPGWSKYTTEFFPKIDLSKIAANFFPTQKVTHTNFFLFTKKQLKLIELNGI